MAFKFIERNGFKFAIQSYSKGKFVNLSPMLNYAQHKMYPFGLGSIKIEFGKTTNKVSSDGKENETWKQVASVFINDMLIDSQIEQALK